MSDLSDRINAANPSVPQRLLDAEKKLADLEKQRVNIKNQHENGAIAKLDDIDRQIKAQQNIIDYYNTQDKQAAAPVQGSWPLDGWSSKQIERFLKDAEDKAKADPAQANNLYIELERLQQQALQQLKANHPKDGVYHDKEGRLLPNKSYVQQGDSAAVFLNKLHGVGLLKTSTARKVNSAREKYYNENVLSQANPILTGAQKNQLPTNGNVIKDIRSTAHEIAHAIDNAATHLLYGSVSGFNTAIYNCKNKMSQLELLMTGEMEKQFANTCIMSELTKCDSIWQLDNMQQYRSVLLKRVQEAQHNAKMQSWIEHNEGIDAVDNGANLNFAGDYSGGK